MTDKIILALKATGIGAAGADIAILGVIGPGALNPFGGTVVAAIGITGAAADSLAWWLENVRSKGGCFNIQIGGYFNELKILGDIARGDWRGALAHLGRIDGYRGGFCH